MSFAIKRTMNFGKLCNQVFQQPQTSTNPHITKFRDQIHSINQKRPFSSEKGNEDRKSKYTEFDSGYEALYDMFYKATLYGLSATFGAMLGSKIYDNASKKREDKKDKI